MSVPFLSPPSNEAPKDVLRRVLKQGPVPGGFDTAEAWLRAWFDPLEFSLKDEEIDVRFPHVLFASWFEQHGRGALEKAAHQIWGTDARLRYDGTLSGVPSRDDLPSLAARRESEAAARPKTLSPPRSSAFEGFFCGGKNQFTLNILRGTAEGTRVYTPLLLRGAPGTGKTHLLRAAAQTLEKTGKVLFFSAPDFTALFRNKGRDEARRALLSCAAVCVDDVHLLAECVESQEELAALIDDMAQRRRPVLCAAVVSSESSRSDPGHEDRDPVTELTPGLLSRLCMGMVLELAEPDLDVRLRYAQARLAEYGLDTGKDMALLLARRCGGLRRLHGVILRIDAFRAQSGRLPDENDMDTILRSTGNPRALTPDAVLALVASRCGYTSKDLRGRKRDPKLVRARQIAMYLCRELLGESYPSLGRMFGGKDHSTVIHAVKKIKATQVTNKDVHILVTELTQSCRKHLA